MKLLTVDTLEGAREKLRACFSVPPIGIERRPLAEAGGRALAKDIIAGEPIPSFRRATVDGYAVIAADTACASETIPALLTMKGTVHAGETSGYVLQTGECIAVATGAPLPEGADAMVMTEYCERVDTDSIAVYNPATFGSGMVNIGEDVEKGTVLLTRGTLLRPWDIGALAANGITEVPVFTRLRMSIISTGDELVNPSEPCSGAQVRDVNTEALAALAVQSGYTIVSKVVIPDDALRLEQAICGFCDTSDVVVVSGGSSQGDKDETADTFQRIANTENLVSGIAVKPGKPTIIGFDTNTNTLLMGLPGHPAAALMTFKLLLTWLYAAMTYQKPGFPIPARLSCNLAGTPGRLTLQPVTLAWDGTAYTATPVFGTSGMITTMTKADGYIMIAMNREGLKKDTPVLVYMD